MYEGDLVASGPATGLPVDEAHPVGFQHGETGMDIVHTEGEVVEPRASTGQKTAHRGIGRERLQELDFSDECHGDALGGENFQLGTTRPCEEFVEGPGVRDRGGRNPHMIDVKGRHGWTMTSEDVPEEVIGAIPEIEIQGPESGSGVAPGDPNRR